MKTIIRAQKKASFKLEHAQYNFLMNFILAPKAQKGLSQK